MKPALWYLSFANEKKFLGGVFVVATDIGSAAYKCHSLKINPGGQVLGRPVDADQIADVPKEAVNRLLSADDLNRLLPSWGFTKLKDAEDRGLVCRDDVDQLDCEGL